MKGLAARAQGSPTAVGHPLSLLRAKQWIERHPDVLDLDEAAHASLNEEAARSRRARAAKRIIKSVQRSKPSRQQGLQQDKGMKQRVRMRPRVEHVPRVALAVDPTAYSKCRESFRECNLEDIFDETLELLASLKCVAPVSARQEPSPKWRENRLEAWGGGATVIGAARDLCAKRKAKTIPRDSSFKTETHRRPVSKQTGVDARTWRRQRARPQSAPVQRKAKKGITLEAPRTLASLASTREEFLNKSTRSLDAQIDAAERRVQRAREKAKAKAETGLKSNQPNPIRAVGSSIDGRRENTGSAGPDEEQAQQGAPGTARTPSASAEVESARSTGPEIALVCKTSQVEHPLECKAIGAREASNTCHERIVRGDSWLTACVDDLAGTLREGQDEGDKRAEAVEMSLSNSQSIESQDLAEEMDDVDALLDAASSVLEGGKRDAEAPTSCAAFRGERDNDIADEPSSGLDGERSGLVETNLDSDESLGFGDIRFEDNLNIEPEIIEQALRSARPSQVESGNGGLGHGHEEEAKRDACLGFDGNALDFDKASGDVASSEESPQDQLELGPFGEVDPSAFAKPSGREPQAQQAGNPVHLKGRSAVDADPGDRDRHTTTARDAQTDRACDRGIDVAHSAQDSGEHQGGDLNDFSSPVDDGIDAFFDEVQEPEEDDVQADFGNVDVSAEDEIYADLDNVDDLGDVTTFDRSFSGSQDAGGSCNTPLGRRDIHNSDASFDLDDMCEYSNSQGDEREAKDDVDELQYDRNEVLIDTTEFQLDEDDVLQIEEDGCQFDEEELQLVDSFAENKSGLALWGAEPGDEALPIAHEESSSDSQALDAIMFEMAANGASAENSLVKHRPRK